jgi:uncharacterized membrane protein AbrB (regulator of aidB expression)
LPPDRATNIVAFVFGVAALVAVVLSVFVMASRPWGCSATDNSQPVCDWLTSRVIAAAFLAPALVVSFVAWKRWKLPLAIIAGALLVVGLVSVVGVYSLAPAALWFGCAMWLWAQGRRTRMIWSGVATVPLLYLAGSGALASVLLYFTPV